MTKSTNKKNHKLTITAGITLPVVLFFVYYYNIGPRPDLEKYNLKEQLPKPQNEVAVNELVILSFFIFPLTSKETSLVYEIFPSNVQLL